MDHQARHGTGAPNFNLGDRWLTRTEASLRGAIGKSTLARLDAEGKGPPAVRIGKSVRYRASDFDRWVASHAR
ncbi:MAG: helix-turn-helix domain-containing protein [Pseudorhodoplanes sp.]|nr:helix-turn-helix domain-containing protein [Pseudorhodoplanes sp.]